MEAIYGGFEQDCDSVDKMTGGRWSARERKASLASEEYRESISTSHLVNLGFISTKPEATVGR